MQSQRRGTVCGYGLKYEVSVCSPPHKMEGEAGTVGVRCEVGVGVLSSSNGEGSGYSTNNFEVAWSLSYSIKKFGAKAYTSMCAACVRRVCGVCAVCVRCVCGVCAVCARARVKCRKQNKQGALSALEVPPAQGCCRTSLEVPPQCECCRSRAYRRRLNTSGCRPCRVAQFRRPARVVSEATEACSSVGGRCRPCRVAQ